MNFIMFPWTKDEREVYKDSSMHYHRYDLGEYMEDLVSTWHDYASNWIIAGEYVSLYAFLGLQEDEINDWADKGTIPDRIQKLWEEGNY